MTKFMTYEELKNHCKYSRYKEEININYLLTEDGKKLMNGLSMFNYEKDYSITKRRIPINDFSLYFLSFCTNYFLVVCRANCSGDFWCKFYYRICLYC